MFSLQRPETNQVGWQLETKILKKKNAKNQPTTQTKLNYQTRCPPAPNLSCTKVQGYRGRPKPFPNMKGWVLPFFTPSTCAAKQFSCSSQLTIFCFTNLTSCTRLLSIPFCHDHPILVSAEPAFCGLCHLGTEEILGMRP